MMIRKPLAAVALIASLALLSACSGGSGSGGLGMGFKTTTQPADDQAAGDVPTTGPDDQAMGDAHATADPATTPAGDASYNSTDDAARADAAFLGMKIAIWYVDNDGAPPAITIEGGDYFMDGEDLGATDFGVDFGGVSGTGYEDWCVWVTAPKGDLKDFQYSSMGGLEPGTCAK